MSNIEELVARLQVHLPALRQLISGLPKAGQQYIKISELYDMISGRKRVKYDTLEMCENAVQTLLNKARPKQRRVPDVRAGSVKNAPSTPAAPLRNAPTPVQSPRQPAVKAFAEGILPAADGCNEPRSPDDGDEIRSPDDDEGLNLPERYESEWPSIYAVVADTLQAPVSPNSIQLGQGQVLAAALAAPPIPRVEVPQVDTSKPPISQKDLFELLCPEVDPHQDGADKGREHAQSADKGRAVEDKTKDGSGVGRSAAHKSKVSLVPTPFHKKMRKNNAGAELSHKAGAGEGDAEGKSPARAKLESKTKAGGHALKAADKSAASDARGGRCKKDGKGASSQSGRGAEKKMAEVDSIFGTLLSSIDEQLISDKPKARRDSKDSENSKGEQPAGAGASSSGGGGGGKHSKDRDRLLGKIRGVEKDMAAALNKSGMSKSEQEDVRRKYGDRIRRYRKELGALKRSLSPSRSNSKSKSRSRSRESSKSKERKPGDKAKAKEEEKDSGRGKEKDQRNERARSKSKDAADKAKEQGKQADKVQKDGKVEERRKEAPAPVTTATPITFIIKKKTDDLGAIGASSATTPSVEKQYGPLEPPPLPLGFQGFNPFANEIAETNRLNAARRARTPLPEAGADHAQPQLAHGHLDHAQAQNAQLPPPHPRDPRFRRMRTSLPPHASVGVRREELLDADFQRRPDMAAGMGATPRMQMPHPRMQQRGGAHARWEPPPPLPPAPPALGWQQAPEPAWQRGNLMQPHQHAGFHPFEPIGNAGSEYDLSQMAPQDFYSPPNSGATVPQNYRQWRQLRERDEKLRQAMQAKLAKGAPAARPPAKKDATAEAAEATVEPPSVEPLPTVPASQSDAGRDDEKPGEGVAAGAAVAVEEQPDAVGAQIDGLTNAVAAADDAKFSEVDRKNLLLLLSKANMMNAPTESLVRFFKNFMNEAEPCIDATKRKDGPDEGGANVEGAPGLRSALTSESAHAEDDTMPLPEIATSPDAVPELGDSAVKAAEMLSEINSIAAEAGTPPPRADTPPRGATKVAAATAKVTDEPFIGRRLRKRTKSINYNEVKISDSEDSPKAKRRRRDEVSPSIRLEASKESPKTVQESSIAPPEKTDELSKELRDEVAVKETEAASPTVDSDSDDVLNSSVTTIDMNEQLTDAERIADDVDPTANMLKVIEEVASGTLCVQEKIDRLLQQIEELEAQNLIRYIECNVTEHWDEEELVGAPLQGDANAAAKRKRAATPASIAAVTAPMPSPAASTTKASPDLDWEVEKIEKKRVRKSELEKLHQDIKDCLGDGIMGVSRRGGSNNNTNASSRTSSPASVVAGTGVAHAFEGLDLKDVKVPPAAGELLKKGKVLRVVLEKLPDTHDVCASPTVAPGTRPRLSRATKSASTAEAAGAEPEVASASNADAPGKQAAAAPDVVPDKNYYLKFEKSDVNACQLCAFSGAAIIAHYVERHAGCEVLISRLSPVATQEAFQEAVHNERENAAAPSARKVKFDFRCRFCSHDLQKETVATFYDHVSTHTGEQRFHCTGCAFKHHVKHKVKQHMAQLHGSHAEPRVDDPPPHADKLFGFICSECNYLQLKKDAITEHIGRYHDRAHAYVYTINLSLPILQHRLSRRWEEKAEVDAGAQVPGERRLRSSQRLKNAEPERKPEKKIAHAAVKSAEKEEKEVDAEGKAEAGDKRKLDEAPAEVVEAPVAEAPVAEAKESPPKSAFVCDNLDELLSMTKEPVVTATPVPKRSISFVDQLKKRLDEQERTTSPPRDVFLLSPIDKEVDCSSELMNDSEAETEPDVDLQAKPVSAPPSFGAPPKSALPKRALALSKPLTKLLSVGVIDAMVDDDGTITYVCRKAACIFKTTDSRVHQVHCTYTHRNCDERLQCSLCPTQGVALPMKEVFAHLCDHVEQYLQARARPPHPVVTIKVEREDVDEEPKLDAAVRPSGDDAAAAAAGAVDAVRIKEEVVSPPKLFFKIAKVESLAARPSEPPPLAPLTVAARMLALNSSAVKTLAATASACCSSTAATLTLTTAPSSLNAAISSTTASIVKELSVRCNLVPMQRNELKMERKSPKVVAEWLQQGLAALFKCPQYDCHFYTHSDEAFDEHINKGHDFRDAFIPCLYCNFKMKKDYFKIHLMMRHAMCNFGCGHCLYRALKADYVRIHHEVSHPGRALSVQPFDLSDLTNPYRPPPMPQLKDIVMPYECGCGLTYYCTKNYEHHRERCAAAPRTNAASAISHFNCRYCPRSMPTITDVKRHIAIEHPFSEVAIVCRQLKDDTVRDEEEGANTLESLIVLEDAGAAPPGGGKLKPLVAPSGAEPVSKLSNGMSIMLLRPVVLNNVGKGSDSPSPTTASPKPSITLGAKAKLPTAVTAPAAICTPGPTPASAAAATSTTPTPVTIPASTPKFLVATPTNGAPASNGGTPSVTKATSAAIASAKPHTHAQPARRKSPPLVEVKASPVLEEDALADLYRCNECLAVSENAAKFSSHLAECGSAGAAKCYICHHCKKSYKIPSKLSEHIRVHGIQNLLCGLCSCRRSQLSQLKRHVKEVHKLNNIVLHPVHADKTNVDVDLFIGKPLITAPKVPPSLAAAAAATNMSGARELASSIINEEGSNAYGPSDIAKIPMHPIFKAAVTCAICNFTTLVRSNFLRHLRLHSSGHFDSNAHVGEAVNPVPCLEKNELMFDKMTNLAASSFEGRMGAKPGANATATPVADASPKASPDAHAAVPEESVDARFPDFIPDNRRYVCGATGCNYLCLEEQNLRHHIQALHDNEQSYTCSHCRETLAAGRSNFIDIDRVIEHLRLHDRALYKCPYCGCLSGKNSNIYRHCADKHPEKPATPITIRQVAPQPAEGTAEKTARKRPWKCAICASRKVTEDEMRVHAREKHTLEAQFKCTYCQFKDDSRAAIKQHFAEHHPKVSLDVIVAYYREEREDADEKLPTGGQFDTTPLWVKNRDTVKTIRGILLDMEAGTAKRTAKPAAGKVAKEKEREKEKSVVKTNVRATAGPGSAANKRRMSVTLENSSAKKPNIDEPSPPTAARQAMKSEHSPIATTTTTTANVTNASPAISLTPTLSRILHPKRSPATKAASFDTAIIEIADDEDEDVPTAPHDAAEPTIEELLFMPIEELEAMDCISTYGPFGKPRGTHFACPLCNKVYANENPLLQHLRDELQYERYECVLCGNRTTTYIRMKRHYEEKHLVLCEKDSENVRELEANASIDLWLRKLSVVQNRLIALNQQRSDTGAGNVRWYRCEYCVGFKTKVRTLAVSHCMAAHAGLPVSVLELKEVHIMPKANTPKTS